MLGAQARYRAAVGKLFQAIAQDDGLAPVDAIVDLLTKTGATRNL